MSTIGNRTIKVVIEKCAGLIKLNQDLLDREYCAAEGKFKPKIMMSFEPSKTGRGVHFQIALKIPQKDLEYEAAGDVDEGVKDPLFNTPVSLDERRRREILFRDFSEIIRRLDLLFKRLRQNNDVLFRNFG